MLCLEQPIRFDVLCQHARRDVYPDHNIQSTPLHYFKGRSDLGTRKGKDKEGVAKGH